MLSLPQSYAFIEQKHSLHFVKSTLLVIEGFVGGQLHIEHAFFSRHLNDVEGGDSDLTERELLIWERLVDVFEEVLVEQCSITQLAQLGIVFDVVVEFRLGNHHAELLFRLVGDDAVDELVVEHIDFHRLRS